ncbi:ABC transporter ATP-binding protein [Brucella thiophenivorans]|uniref:ABC transporter ATP-binding protein n=1 Tax=Brucella thiophenivorans TaxID=571255 RepID=UPI000B988D9B|nr:ABC transporter ATP-binding protein [Brucella thiophenivorans]
MLKVENISARYGVLEAVSDASFFVGEGQVVSLIGANGAGKSTTLKCIMGLLPAASGKVEFDGHNITHASSVDRVGKGISLSPEGRKLFPRMTVIDNLLTGAHCARGRATITESLDLIFGLFPRVAERRKQIAGSLSGGEQQMVAIGRALMSRPKLLMLDEPSLGLAPKVTEEIENAIIRIGKSQGMSVLLVEQNAHLALRLSHHAYVYEKGKVVYSGPGSELATDPEIQRRYLGV